MLNRLSDASDGEILFEGREISSLKGAARRE
jgi:ABC-type proline/glycine betaine transport system ATPase subunit